MFPHDLPIKTKALVFCATFLIDFMSAAAHRAHSAASNAPIAVWQPLTSLHLSLALLCRYFEDRNKNKNRNV